MNPVSITGVKEQIKYKRDEIALQRVKVATLKSYLDIQPMIKRHCIHILSSSRR